LGQLRQYDPRDYYRRSKIALDQKQSQDEPQREKEAVKNPLGGGLDGSKVDLAPCIAGKQDPLSQQSRKTRRNGSQNERCPPGGRSFG
jgi:hypothetical protein